MDYRNGDPVMLADGAPWPAVSYPRETLIWPGEILRCSANGQYVYVSFERLNHGRDDDTVNLAFPPSSLREPTLAEIRAGAVALLREMIIELKAQDVAMDEIMGALLSVYVNTSEGN